MSYTKEELKALPKDARATLRSQLDDIEREEAQEAAKEAWDSIKDHINALIDKAEDLADEVKREAEGKVRELSGKLGLTLRTETAKTKLEKKSDTPSKSGLIFYNPSKNEYSITGRGQKDWFRNGGQEQRKEWVVTTAVKYKELTGKEPDATYERRAKEYKERR